MGTYKLILDTISPKISKIGNNDLKSFNQYLEFKITDSQSGLEDYNVFIDNRWVLSNYSPRTNKLRVPLDKYSQIKSGNHKCRVEAIDERSNKSYLDLEFKFTDK